MFERIPDVGGPSPNDKGNSLAQAMYESLHGDGIRCPHGCPGCACRMYGLVSHLVDKHGYTEKKAWKKAEQSL